ncbi:MAG: ZPR1 zinc finger domain-containing protein [Candidatus Woesearchaeota archaeon]|jgi:zinc finger protein|nr:ZPR1 zinc finger domain-containing protein [Candidatus Woesearchaeota archaeon]
MAQENDRDIMIIENQECPVCAQKKATFSEYEIEDPFAGTIAIFSIKCLACGFKNSDLEFENVSNPAEYTLEVESKEDLNIRVIKSGSCEVKIPNFRISVESTMSSEGFISNVEGVLNRFKEQIMLLKGDDDLEKAKKKRIKTILKGIEEVMNGERKITIKLKDETGNSAIISDKVQVKKLRVKK